ncbi:hypothetical protein Poly41_25560 [Novipirellula artificiosorum]|uniref:Uncharacterized protein n=1 Tax=Novipirellula artificiosorum TaxID=2528016 RepID=A0A5C6DSJ1_9BACT|nr:hypothetical protein Poly41_25560 [Novipirellula artificiosorum]
MQKASTTELAGWTAHFVVDLLQYAESISD